jgi:hypothetical protein
MSSAWETRMVDIIAAYYASQGEVKACSLNNKKFKDVLNILVAVPELYPDLVKRSKAMRVLRGGVCHMDCHVIYMLNEEKGVTPSDNTH